MLEPWLANVSVNGQIVNTLGFVGHTISVGATQQRESSHRQKNTCGCVQIKLYLQNFTTKQAVGQLASSCVRGSNSWIPGKSETEAENGQLTWPRFCSSAGLTTPLTSQPSLTVAQGLQLPTPTATASKAMAPRPMGKWAGS